MTRATQWIDKHYPVTTVSFVASKPSDAEMIKHALLKWSGLTRDVLDRYGLDLDETHVVENRSRDRVLGIDSRTCALCQVYWKGDLKKHCIGCPLALSRGGVPCDHRTDREMVTGSKSPWSAFAYQHDPHPMIDALNNALKFVETQGETLSSKDKKLKEIKGLDNLALVELYACLVKVAHYDIGAGTSEAEHLYHDYNISPDDVADILLERLGNTKC